MSQTRALIDKLLTNVSQKYNPEGLVADLILPIVGSKAKTGKLGKYNKGHLRIEHSLGGGRSEYRRVNPLIITTDSYDIQDHGLEDIVTEDDMDNFEEPFDAEVDKTEGLKMMIAVEKEYALSSTLTNTAILTQNVTLAGTSQFSDKLNSDPISVFETARKAVRDGSGFPPNLAVMDWAVYNVLKNHPQMLEFLGFTQQRPGGLKAEELTLALGVDKVIVASGMYNTAKEGQADVLGALWGKDIVFMRSPAAAAKQQMSLGYQVKRSRRMASQVYKYAINNPPGATGILCVDSYDWFITDVTAGYLVKNAIA